MKPIHVTFEQGQILKSKGFNMTSEDGYEEGHHSFFQHKSGEIKALSHYYFDTSPQSIQYKDLNIQAPEQWQVIEWLRVNHKINLKYEPSINDLYESWIYKIGWRYIGSYHSPQEAYSAAFDYILKNLI